MVSLSDSAPSRTFGPTYGRASLASHLMRRRSGAGRQVGLGAGASAGALPRAADRSGSWWLAARVTAAGRYGLLRHHFRCETLSFQAPLPASRSPLAPSRRGSAKWGASLCTAACSQVHLSRCSARPGHLVTLWAGLGLLTVPVGNSHSDTSS